LDAPAAAQRRDAGVVPTISFVTVTRPVMVIGSTQPWSDVDHGRAAAAGTEVVRRHSGGGAVLLVPGGQVWAEIVVPAGDPLWQADVNRATHWLGRAWTQTLRDLGVNARRHAGGMVAGPWSWLACFGGLGPGEVTVDGRKVVGISQRRTRGGARFQCAVLLRWDPAALVHLLVMEEQQRERASAALAEAAVPAGVDRLAIEETFTERLSRL